MTRREVADEGEWARGVNDQRGYMTLSLILNLTITHKKQASKVYKVKVYDVKESDIAYSPLHSPPKRREGVRKIRTRFCKYIQQKDF